MKTLFFAIFTFAAFSNPSFAQRKAIQKAVIQTPGIQAEACKTGVENFLKHEYGISTVKADYRRHTVTVTWYTDRTNIENIKTALANMGYDADDVTANPDSYKRLPAPCRYKADTTKAIK